MYAKLVVGGTQINVLAAMRDIGRLITSATPSLSLVGAFNVASSVIIDNTPAGWSYVGGTGTADQPNIAPTSQATVTSGQFNFCFSAPMQNNPSLLKYAALTNNNSAALYTVAGTGFNLTGARNATSLGVLTNEGPRYFATIGSISNVTALIGTCITVDAGVVLHVIANPQHITIVSENVGMAAVWETTPTDVQTFYNYPAFVQYSHYKSSSITQTLIYAPTKYENLPTLSTTWSASSFAVTNPNNGTFYGVYDVSNGGTLNTLSLVNSVSTALRANTISATGAPQYAISPIFFTNTLIGHPTQFVTGPVPAYYVSGNMGNTGDTVSVSGDTYFFFNAGAFGLLMKTT
jgi:hypothetical protein